MEEKNVAFSRFLFSKSIELDDKSKDHPVLQTIKKISPIHISFVKGTATFLLD